MDKRHQGHFTVVVPTLNEGSLLTMTIENILSHTTYPNYEIIVVDDGSTDGSCATLAALDPRVRVIRSEGLGVARARNLGAALAQGEYVVFLDAHCRVSSDWLRGLAVALGPADVGVAGPCFTRLHEPEPRGCGMIWSDAHLDPTWFEPVPTRRPYAVPLTTGACQAFRLATFTALGHYEEGFTRWGFEDVEICLRAWLLGYRVVVNPTVIVAHYFRESRGYEVEDVAIMSNFLRMIHLHFSPPRIRRVLRTLGNSPLVAEGLDRLYRSNIFDARATLLAARVQSDDWFFQYVNCTPNAI